MLAPELMNVPESGAWVTIRIKCYGEWLRWQHCLEKFFVVQVTQSCPTLGNPMDCSTLGFPVHHQLPELAQTLVHWVGDTIQPCPSLSSPSPPTSVFPSIRVFSNESALYIRWPKDWSFSLSISPSNEYSGLISFRIDWFDLLAVQGTLTSLFQHHSSKAFILQLSTFFMIALTFMHDYWKNHTFDSMKCCQQSDISGFKYAV